MLNLPKEAQQGLNQLSTDIRHMISNRQINKTKKQHTTAESIQVVLGVCFSTIILYSGLLLLIDYQLLLDRLVPIVLLAVICAGGIGLLEEER